MFLFWLILNAIVMLEAGLTVIKTFRFRKFFQTNFSLLPPDPGRWPRVALLAPFRGTDEDLNQNIDSWFEQDYPHFSIIFIIDSESDAVLNHLKQYPNARIVTAGVATNCGQKVHNLKKAIASLEGDFELLAFVDSDTCLRRDSLKTMVSTLISKRAGATTGYRWFINANNFASQLRSVWNSSVLTLLSESGTHNFTWGGSTVLSKKTFDDCRVLEFWKGSVSDDYGITNALRSCGRKIFFVPRALAFSSDSTDFIGFWRWARRQLLITRIYNPGLWRAAFAFHAIWFVWVLLGVFFHYWLIPSFVFFWLCQIVKAEIRLQCASLAGPEPAGNRAVFFVFAPLTALLNAFLFAATAISNKISWRGIRYSLNGANTLQIQGYDEQ